MLVSAHRIARQLGMPDVTVVGTGPLGAPSGARWITPYDVIRHVPRRVRLSSTRDVWDREDEDGAFALRHPAPRRMELRPHQHAAVAAGMAGPGLFRSGIWDMDCGTGKTWVGGELVRLTSGAPAVVVTQHVISVDQWVRHLKDVVGMSRVVTLADVRRQNTWRIGDPLPDVLVMTYTSLERANARWCARRDDDGEEDVGDALVWLLRLLRFGLLVLDEAHLSVANTYYDAVSGLHASAIVAFSGSLVREDELLTRLHTMVGPVLFQYRSERKLTYEVIRVPLHDTVTCNSEHTRRTRDGFALRTLNPNKTKAMRAVLRAYADPRVVVFCDSATAAQHLQRSLVGIPGRVFVGALHGGVAKDDRDAIVNAFARTPHSVLLTTRVCDAAIDFPEGCMVVQLHSASGSRQQEMQRCGRGTRNESEVSHTVHIINEGTEEEGFLERRIAYMRERHNTLVVHDTMQQLPADDDEHDDEHVRCLEPLTAFLRDAVAHKEEPCPGRRTLPQSSRSRQNCKRPRLL